MLGIVNSSANFSNPVSSSTSINPFGEIVFAKEILAICALKRCLSFPGKGGLESIAALRLPVKMYLIYLAA